MIAIELSSSPTCLNHLTCLVEAAMDVDFDGCDVFTLNHDTLIEKVFDQHRVKFVDGFAKPDGDVAWWEPSNFDSKPERVVLKLHGSLGWARYGGRLAKVLTSECDHAHRADGTMLQATARPPAPLLIGTFNKVRDYFNAPYFDLWRTFRSQMSAIDLLVISGYSFGDKGVNTVLSDWMNASTQSRILILHNSRDGECLGRARGAVRKLWDQFRDSRMFIQSAYLNECDWPSLRSKYQF